TCVGWQAGGAGVGADCLSRLSFSLEAPSVFRELLESDLYVGRLVPSAVHDALAAALGPPRPSCVIAAAIRIRDKVVAALLGECAAVAPQRRAFEPVVQAAEKAAAALLRLILERKRAA